MLAYFFLPMESRNMVALHKFDAFVTHADLIVYDVIDTDCWGKKAALMVVFYVFQNADFF